MLNLDLPVKKTSQEMPSLNHSYLCSRILRQLFENQSIEALTELTIDIDNGLTPDICVYPSEVIQPNFSRDVTKMQKMPILAIEVISASQNIQDILEKAEQMVKSGVKAVWSVEPYTRAVFVTTEQGEQIIYHRKVASEGIEVDFKMIFGE
jgi:Uma2 family endonuclease